AELISVASKASLSSKDSNSQATALGGTSRGSTATAARSPTAVASRATTADEEARRRCGMASLLVGANPPTTRPITRTDHLSHHHRPTATPGVRSDGQAHAVTAAPSRQKP